MIRPALLAPLALLLAASAAPSTPPTTAPVSAGVDLVLSKAGTQVGAPCAIFDQVPYFPWVTGGEAWLIRAYAAPNTPHFVLFGPPPTNHTPLPGVENLLMIHAPVSVIFLGMTGPLDSFSFCGQGHKDYPITIPKGPSGGADFAMQLVGISSTTGNWAFSKQHWITYL